MTAALFEKVCAVARRVVQFVEHELYGAVVVGERRRPNVFAKTPGHEGTVRENALFRVVLRRDGQIGVPRHLAHIRCGDLAKGDTFQALTD